MTSFIVLLWFLIPLYSLYSTVLSYFNEKSYAYWRQKQVELIEHNNSSSFKSNDYFEILNEIKEIRRNSFRQWKENSRRSIIESFTITSFGTLLVFLSFTVILGIDVKEDKNDYIQAYIVSSCVSGVLSILYNLLWAYTSTVTSDFYFGTGFGLMTLMSLESQVKRIKERHAVNENKLRK